jgi:hypothetical protein
MLLGVLFNISGSEIISSSSQASQILFSDFAPFLFIVVGLGLISAIGLWIIDLVERKQGGTASELAYRKAMREARKTEKVLKKLFHQ